MSLRRREFLQLAGKLLILTPAAAAAWPRLVQAAAELNSILNRWQTAHP